MNGEDIAMFAFVLYLWSLPKHNLLLLFLPVFQEGWLKAHLKQL